MEPGKPHVQKVYIVKVHYFEGAPGVLGTFASEEGANQCKALQEAELGEKNLIGYPPYPAAPNVESVDILEVTVK
jgi:hypothetical protein